MKNCQKRCCTKNRKVVFDHRYRD